MTSPWSSSTASSWEHAVVAGTGVVGVLLYGDPRRHVLSFSHERFFVPVNRRRPAPELASVLPAVRAALDGGDERKAADIVRDRLLAQDIDPEELVWTDPLGPVAQLVWEMDPGAVRSYRRETPVDDLGTAVSWSTKDMHAGLRVLAKHGDESVQVELWSDAPLAGILTLGPVDERRASAPTIAGIDYASQVNTTCEVLPNELVAVVTASGYEPGTGISARVVISSPEDMKTQGPGWRVQLAANTPLRLTVAVETDAPGPRGVTREPTSALASSQLTLSDVTDDDRSNERVWEAARGGDAESERRALERAYAAGRRNIIAATGALPPTLQGVWQGTWTPAWSADYTMNGNVQLGALAASLWTGTPSAMHSLFNLIRQYPEDYRANARSIFGIDGMLLPARLTTHGHANHFLRSYPHQFWVGHGSWFLRMATDYIWVTGDRAILDKWLWEFATEILEFGVALLNAGGGRLSPSYSPENIPAGRDNPLVINATGDIAALRDGLRVGSWLATLKGDDAAAERWSRARERLPKFRIAEDGTLAEWDQRWPEHLEHRHSSQLHGLWYEVDDAFRVADLRKAALNTVQRKIAWRAAAPFSPPGRMEMAFGLSSLGIAAANLGDAESAYQCALWLARDHFTPALVSTHDAGAIFNLDASGALPAVVAAMLLSSEIGLIRLLPALPAAWPHGSVTGLTGRGGVDADEISWSATELDVSVRLLAEAEWLRPDATRIELPRPGVLRPTVGVEQIGPCVLLLNKPVGEFTFHVAFRPSIP